MLLHVFKWKKIIIFYFFYMLVNEVNLSHSRS